MMNYFFKKWHDTTFESEEGEECRYASVQQWNGGTVVLTAGGWAALVYRIRAEERLLAQEAGWAAYVRAVRGRLLPGLW